MTEDTVPQLHELAEAVRAAEQEADDAIQRIAVELAARVAALCVQRAAGVSLVERERTLNAALEGLAGIAGDLRRRLESLKEIKRMVARVQEGAMLG